MEQRDGDCTEALMNKWEDNKLLLQTESDQQQNLEQEQMTIVQQQSARTCLRQSFITKSIHRGFCDCPTERLDMKGHHFQEHQI